MKNRHEQNIYKRMQRFADITKEFIKIGNVGRAKRCLNVAETIFNQSTEDVKNVIGNIYVYSISSFMELHNCKIKAK
jgi:hypothetical protein